MSCPHCLISQLCGGNSANDYANRSRQVDSAIWPVHFLALRHSYATLRLCWYDKNADMAAPRGFIRPSLPSRQIHISPPRVTGGVEGKALFSARTYSDRRPSPCAHAHADIGGTVGAWVHAAKETHMQRFVNSSFQHTFVSALPLYLHTRIQKSLSTTAALCAALR